MTDSFSGCLLSRQRVKPGAPQNIKKQERNRTVMRRCLFCLSKANSLEDVWPRWITEQFTSEIPASMQAERNGLALRPWKKQTPELTVKWVCRSCNNGWMSALEQQVKPHLQPLLSGANSPLDVKAQLIISTWAVKTAMALEGIDPPGNRVYSQTQREQLRTLNTIPEHTYVWLAVSADPNYLMSTKTRHIKKEDSSEVNGISTTMAFGHIALQVFTIRVPPNVTASTKVTTDVRRAPWEDVTVRVWPHRPPPLDWPPRKGLNGEKGLNLFAERFSVVGLPKEDLTPIFL